MKNRIWVYQGTINEKEGRRTAISWDGPPSPAYISFVKESDLEACRAMCAELRKVNAELVDSQSELVTLRTRLIQLQDNLYNTEIALREAKYRAGEKK